MNSPALHDWSEAKSRVAVDRPAMAGLELLFSAHGYALDAECSAWEFAVEMADLERAGLSRCDFRWLVVQGYVQHAEEVTRPSSRKRRFQQLAPHQFTARTCFVLTERGASLAEGEFESPPSQLVADAADPSSNGSRHGPAGGADPREAEKIMPSWNELLRELRVGGQLVKRNRQPAPVQSLILCAFEEDDWEQRIDDPLPPRPNLDPCRRLHDAVRSLNANHLVRMIRFHGDGVNGGIWWELID